MLHQASEKILYFYIAQQQRRSAWADRAETEEGFEIAQSMGIALLGLVIAAAFATALEGLGVNIIAKMRAELGL